VYFQKKGLGGKGLGLGEDAREALAFSRYMLDF